MPDDTVAGEYPALWRCEINNASTESEIGTVSGSPWVLQNFPNMHQLRLYAAWVPGAKAEASSFSACRVSAAMLGERGCWQERNRPLAPMPGTFPPADEIESRPSCCFMSGMWTARKMMLWRRQESTSFLIKFMTFVSLNVWELMISATALLSEWNEMTYCWDYLPRHSRPTQWGRTPAM